MRSDIMHCMSDPAQDVLDESETLQQLRRRLHELDTERAAVQEQITACMQRIAAITGREVPPPPNTRLAHQILWVIRSHRTQSLSPIDVAQKLGLKRVSELEKIRVHLSRLRKKGEIRRVSH